jgi:hypothetical protein
MAMSKKKLVATSFIILILFSTLSFTSACSGIASSPKPLFDESLGPFKGNCVTETLDGGYLVSGQTGDWEEDGTRGGYWENSTACLLKVQTNGTLEWRNTYDNGSYSHAEVAVGMADGGFLVAGDRTWKINGSDVIRVFWVFRVNSSGGMEWERTFPELEFGSYRDCSCSDFCKTADGGYAIVGAVWFPGDTAMYSALIKLDQNCNLLWSRTYGGSEGQASRIEGTEDGGCLVRGRGGEYGFAWVLKIDSKGDVQFWKSHDSSVPSIGTLYGAGMWLTPDGGYVLAGSTESSSTPYGGKGVLLRFDSSDNILWSKIYNHSLGSFVRTRDGGFVLSEALWSDMPGVGRQSFFKLSSAGDEEWNVKFDNVNELIYSIIETADGSVVFTGQRTMERTSYPYSIFLSKIGSESAINKSPVPSQSPSPSPSPTNEPTLEPTSTPNQPSSFLGTNLPTEYGYAIVAVLVIIVVAGLSLVYFKKIRK